MLLFAVTVIGRVDLVVVAPDADCGTAVAVMVMDFRGGWVLLLLLLWLLVVMVVPSA